MDRLENCMPTNTLWTALNPFYTFHEFPYANFSCFEPSGANITETIDKLTNRSKLPFLHKSNSVKQTNV